MRTVFSVTARRGDTDGESVPRLKGARIKYRPCERPSERPGPGRSVAMDDRIRTKMEQLADVIGVGKDVKILVWLD